MKSISKLNFIEFQKTKSVVVQALLDQKEWLEYDINKNTNREF